MARSRTNAAVAAWLLVVAAWPGGPARGQMAIPGVPAVPGGAAVAPLVGAAPVAAPVAAAPRTIWSFFGLSKANLAACHERICGSPAGPMLNGMVAPFSGMTGGLIPQFCPTVPSAADAAELAATKGPTSPEAVAAKIKQDEAEAARRAAVRYLSTVSCHYWPEAEAALIVALRDDRNECVRYEAALALLNGCCCTEKTIEALSIVVDGSEKDGKPSELSERVRATAFAALQGCLHRYQPKSPPGPPEAPEPLELERPDDPPPPPPPGPAAAAELEPAFRRVAYYYLNTSNRTEAAVIAEARRVLARAGGRAPAVTAAAVRTGERTVYHALSRAVAPARPRPAPATTVARAVGDAAPPPPPIPIDDRPAPATTTTAPAAAPHSATTTPTARDLGPGPRPTATAPPGAPPTGRRNLRDILFHSLSASR